MTAMEKDLLNWPSEMICWLPTDLQNLLNGDARNIKNDKKLELKSFKAILTLIKNSEYSEALNLCRSVFEWSEYPADLFLLRGRIHHATGDMENLYRCLEAAKDLGGDTRLLQLKTSDLSDGESKTSRFVHLPNKMSGSEIQNLVTSTEDSHSSLPFKFIDNRVKNFSKHLAAPGICFCVSIKNRLWQIRETLHSNLEAIDQTPHIVAISDYSSDDGLEEWLHETKLISHKNLIYRRFNVLDFEWSSPVAKNLAASIAPNGFAIFNLDADNFITSSEVNSFLEALNQGKVVHQFSGVWGDGSYGRIGMPHELFKSLSGYEERLLSMGYQDCDIIKRAQLAGADVVVPAAPHKPAIHNTRDIKYQYCKGVNPEDLNATNKTISDLLIASGSTIACNQISSSILNANQVGEQPQNEGLDYSHANMPLSISRLKSINIGKESHQSQLKDGICVGFVRRNIHRLEKSFCYNPWKPNSGRDFLPMLVLQLIRLKDLPQHHQLFNWGASAVKTYMNNAKNDADWVNDIRLHFSKAGSLSCSKQNPVNAHGKSLVSIDEPEAYPIYCEKLFKRRVSARNFQSAKVDLDLVRKCISLALAAPSACNRQPFRVVLVEDKKNRDGLLDLAPGSKNWAKQAPHLLALVADYINFENDYDHGLALIDTSLFSSFLQLAFVSHGVGSCCLNWPDLDRLHRPAKNLLNLSSTETVVMLLAFGYPSEDGLVPRSLKKSCEDVLTLLE